MTDIESLFAYVDINATATRIECIACDNGHWQTECCNGSYGCSCRGGYVDMGACNVCNGRGYYYSDEQVNTNANWQSISSPFVGSGPKNIADWRPFISQ